MYTNKMLFQYTQNWIFLTILMSIDVKYFKLCVYTIKLSKTKIWALANFGVEPFAKRCEKIGSNQDQSQHILDYVRNLRNGPVIIKALTNFLQDIACPIQNQEFRKFSINFVKMTVFKMFWHWAVQKRLKIYQHRFALVSPKCKF